MILRNSVLVLMVSFCCTGILLAQNESDYLKYAAKTDNVNVVYRGKQSQKYPFVYNGTYYWESPKFEKGSIEYNGKMYWNVYLNIDAFTDEIIIKHSGDMAALCLKDQFADSFIMGEKHFVNLGRRGYDVPKGYYLELYSGDAAVYKKVKKEFSDDIRNANSSNGDPNFNYQIFKLFSPVVTYYYIKDGNVTTINGKKAFGKMYREQRREIRKYIKRSGLNEEKNYDIFCVKLMNFIESGNE